MLCRYLPCSQAFFYIVSHLHCSPIICYAVKDIVAILFFILPVFIHEDSEEKVPITSMPGVFRQPWKTGLVEMVEEARALGINNIILFPKCVDRARVRSPRAAREGAPAPLGRPADARLV